MDPIVSQRKLSVHKEHEVLLKLEAAGLNDELAQKVIESKGNDLAMKVVGLIRNGGFGSSTSQQRARKIMDTNYFGIEEAIKYFGVNPSRQQLAALSEVPFTEETLEKCANTHILVAVFPLSILDICGKVERKLFYRHEHAWYNTQAFAQDHGEIGWHLIRKNQVPNSNSKNWSAQKQLLGKDEETPKARVMVYAIVGHYLNTNERLFGSMHVRASCAVLDVNRVCVGVFDSAGLDVYPYGDDHRDGYLGLASARRPV